MEAKAPKAIKRPIVVELEDGLLKPGLFAEGLWALLRDRPLNAVRLLHWWFNDELSAKVGRMLNSRKVVPPVNPEVLDVVQSHYRQGHQVILKHNRHRELAQSIQYRYGCFSDLTASLPEQVVNQGFIYLTPKGDASLWQKAASGVLVGSPKQAESVKSHFGLDEVVHRPSSRRPLLYALWKSLRPHQWSKSVLVFLPLFLLYRYQEAYLWLQGLKAFISFCLVSSSTYIINDLFDLESDRKHPVNHKRPFAAGDLPLYWGSIIYLLLIGTGLSGAYAISYEAGLTMSTYAAIGLLYTFVLKRIPVLDTFILGGLYVWRVFMGAVVLELALSPWVYLMSLFFFFSLANMKRVSELGIMKEGASHSRRGYNVGDKSVLMVFGVASAFTACVFYPLYLQFEGRSQNTLLWFLGGIMLFWFCYIWLLTWRNRMASDPVKFALTDFISHLCVWSAAAIWLLSSP